MYKFTIICNETLLHFSLQTITCDSVLITSNHDKIALCIEIHTICCPYWHTYHTDIGKYHARVEYEVLSRVQRKAISVNFVYLPVVHMYYIHKHLL